MPGKVKVKILSGRNLPVMDRSSDTTDAYVEVKLGTTTFKTDVCRKSLNPQWNSEWYRFELDDAELQDEPLQIRIMDHDTYSANDAIGKVYIDLNPLLLPQSMGSNAKNSDSLSSITSSSGGSVMSGWFPVYDTMHGIRGEVNVIVKVDLFTDFNKFRQSSCGVQFFNSSVIPQGYTAQIIHGFVEELVVSDDPEYQWIEKIRTPRASNEARQTTFFKLSGEVQRKIGLKVLELGGNCVIGYHQVFDLEGESGIVVRGIGTAVTLARTQDTPQAPGSAPPQISLPPYAAPAPAPPTPLPHDDQRTPSFLSLPKFNLSRLSPTRNILSPLSRLSPRLKRKSTPTPHLDIAKAKPRGSVQSSPGNFSTHGNLDSSDVSAPCEPDFNYSMNILLQQEDGRKNSPKKNRLMQAISSIPRSSRKIYKKFSSADDNISIASKLSLENSDALLSGVLESVEIVNGVSVDDSFELSTSSSSSSSSSSTSSSSSAPPTFEPLIYNYEQSSEPVVDLSNIKHFPRRNSDYSDEVNCILSEKYAGSSIQSISEKREQEERARRRADRESDEELHRKLNYSERVVCRPKIDIREDTMPNVNPSRHSQQRNMEVIGSTIDGQLRDQETSQALSDQGSPKTRKVSMFEGNLLEPNRDSASGRRYSDASQLSPHSSPQNGMTRRHSSSDIRDNDTFVSFESVYGRRLSDLPDLVTVKMSEKKRGPSTAKHETPNPKLNEKHDSNTKITNTTDSAETVPSEAANRGRGINDSKGSVEQRNCSVEIKVDEVENNSTSKEDSNGDFAQQITDSFSFLDSRGTPPMSEMDRVDCEDEKTSEKEKSAVINKDSRPYLSNVKNRIAYKETIFTPRSELMLTVTEPSFDSNSSRQVSFDTDTSHDDLVLESSKEEIEFTGSHFLDLKPKLSKSYENLSSLVDEDLSPERSFSLTNCSDEVTREKKIEDLSKKINELESYPGPPPLKTNFYDPVFGRPLEKLSEESESKSPSFSDEDSKELVGPDEKSTDDVRDSNDQNVSDNGDSSSTKGGQKLSDQSTNIRERNNAQRYGGLNNRLSNNQGSGGDEGDDNPDRDPRPVPQDKQSDEDQDEEEDGEKTPPLSRMSPVVFGDENSNVVNFLSYNVTKSGSLIGVDRFNDSDSRFQMSLMNMNNVSRSNPNLSSDTKVRLTPRDKSRSMFDLVIVSSDPDKSSLGSRRSSVKKSGKMFRRRESKSAENVSRTPPDKTLPKQPVLSDENLQDSGSAPAQPPVRKDSVFARRKISLTNDLNRRESKSNGNLTESVENLASTLLTRRGSVNLKRNNSITRKTSVTGESPFKKGNKALQEHESYENVAGTVLMRRDSVKRMPEGRLKKQNSLSKELDRKQSQSSENIRPTYRDPFGDHLMSRSSSITSVSEYRETLRKLLKSQESIEEINESDPTLNRTNGDRKLESKSLVDITEQLEGDESVNKSESNIHKMIAVPKPTSILKNKIDFVPIPTDLTNQKKNNNQSKARNFFGEDIDLNSIESDAKYKHESSPSNVHYSRIMANREDPLESRYSHIIANRIIVKPKQPVPDTKIQNGKDLQKRCPPPAQPHLKSNDYLVQKDFRTPARLQNIDYIKHREDSVDSTIVSEEIINSPLQFTDFSHNDPVMKKLLTDSKKKAENEIDLVFGESTLQDEDLVEFVTKFIDAEIKANLLQRYEEGEKPLAVSVPSIESVSLKTQNFTAKFIEVERDACETQRIKGQNKKKKSVLIIKSTEPNFNTMENTFIIGTSPDEAHVTDKLIQEEDIEQSTTQLLRLSNTPQYSDSMEEETSQQSTAEFLERERVYSAFQQPHLVLVKKLGDKTSHVPICDGLKTESKIKDELEKTIKFLQTEREFSSLQMQAIVKLVRKSIESIDSIRIENEILKRALTFTQNFIENEKKFVAKDSVDLCVPSYSPNERSASKPKPQQKQIPSNEEKEERSSIPGSASKHGSQKKKSPSIEKEKRSPTKKKCPTQEEIDMILKRQSYDFALSKMNMTGVIPNINSYKTRQTSRDEETPYQVSLNERSEPNYGYIISQSSLNKHTYQQSPIKQFKMERNRLSGEEVLIEENTKVSSEDECKLSEIKPDEKQAINSEGSKTMQNFLSNEETTTQVIDQSYLNSIPREKSVDISDKKEIKTDTSKESSVEKEIPKQLSHEIPSVIETQTTMTEISDSKDESTESFCRVDRPIEEDSIDETESTIVNFFSASMETIKSRHTGHSDDFSDFNESVESGPAETCDTLPDHSELTEPVATKPPSQSVRDEMVQETCDEEAQEHDTEMSENSTDKNSDEISPPIVHLEPKEIVLEVSAREPEPEDLYEHTLASNNSFNESVARNVDMIDNNLSPKSSASEVLSDSTIDNQLNECRNCRHSKIDSLDFFSDEDLKSSIDQTSNENTVDEQLETLKAEKQEADGSPERNVPHEATNLELQLEICEYENEEQMILEDKSDDKSPDLVVTQETSANVDIESLTPVAAPRTKKKKKKKHHASKENLNASAETQADEIDKSDMTVLTEQKNEISSTSAENNFEKTNEEGTDGVVLQHPLICDEHFQVSVESQEDSDSKSKPKKKRKRRLTITKATKEEPIQSSQIDKNETVEAQDQANESQKETVGLEKKRNESEREKLEEVNYLIKEEVQQDNLEQCPNDEPESKTTETTPANTTGESKTLKKKKVKLTRHTTQALSDILKPEIVVDASHVDTPFPVPPPESFSDVSQPEILAEVTEPADSCTSENEPGLCPEICDIPGHGVDDCYRLDEVCESIVDEESSNENEGDALPCETCTADAVDVCPKEYAVSNEALINRGSDTCPSEQLVEASPSDSVPDETCSDASAIGLCLSAPRNFLSRELQREQEVLLQGARRVDINTGLDVINSRLGVINQEISTIAHVLSNINDEIRHGGSTVVLDVPLDVSERERIQTGRRGTASLPNVLDRAFCCQSGACHLDSNETFKSLGAVVLKGFSAKEARLVNQAPPAGSGHSEGETLFEKETGLINQGLSSFGVNAVQPTTPSIGSVVLDDVSSFVSVNNTSANRVTNATDAGPLTPLVCDANLAPSPSHVPASVLRVPPEDVNGSYDATGPGAGVSTSSNLGISAAITRRSSESDLSITPKGNSLAGSGGSSGGFGGARIYSGPPRSAAMFKENLDMLEYPFLTMSKYPPGFILRVGGTVRANSVKLLERMTNLEEPESRDAWWTELRLEVRSHARALACNVVLGYSEHTAICDDVCVLSASGTAAVINVCLGGSLHAAGAEVADKFSKLGQNGAVSDSPLSNLIEHKADVSHTRQCARCDELCKNVRQPMFRPRDNLEMPLLPCRFCHVPYNEASVPFKVNLVKCAVCKKGKVPDLIFATIEPPDNVPITGSSCFIQAFVSRSKRDCKGELNAKEISDGLPFLEYELHRQLMNKLTVKGMNALFGLKVQKCIGERTLAAYATATAAYLSPLPPPALPKVTAGDAWKDGNTIAEMQRMLQDCVQENRDFFRLRRCSDIDRLLVSDSDESEEEVLPDIDLNAGGKDTCILEMDDAEDISVVSQLIDPHPPRGFHVSSIETLPGLDQLEVVKNLQMFTQVWRSRVPSTTTVNKHFQRLLQTMYYKLRRMTPCAIAKLSFHIDIPEPEEVQLSVVGMALGLGEVDKSVKSYRRRLLSCHSKDTAKDDGATDLIFRLDEDQNEAGSPAPHNRTPEDKTPSTVKPSLPPSRSPDPLSSTRPPLGQSRGAPQAQDRGPSLEDKDGKTSTLFTSHTPPKEHYGVDITPLSYIAGGRIERYLGNLNFFFIRESNCIRESGGLSGFVHSFVTEVLTILRAHVTALGGNAMVSYTMTHCILLNNAGKNQGQCLINVGGDVVFVSYPSQGSEDRD